jgi:phosphoribosylaminoimidazole synthetase
MSSTKLTYQQAGVDTKEAAALVGDIGKLRSSTEGKRKLYGAFGLFAAAYDLSSYKQPVIVTGCDGVGTKLELLLHHDLLETAGKDLVAMNVNDVLTTGGDPIMFLDYLGIPKIDKVQISRLIAGMTEWLAACDCILAGGETAEMPGIVPEGFVEMSGFAIGAVEKPDLIQPERVQPGDAVIGFPSDGFHANGWSLVRRVLREHAEDFSTDEIIAMLAPTRLYHEEVRAHRAADRIDPADQRIGKFIRLGRRKTLHLHQPNHLRNACRVALVDVAGAGYDAVGVDAGRSIACGHLHHAMVEGECARSRRAGKRCPRQCARDQILRHHARITLRPDREPLRLSRALRIRAETLVTPHVRQSRYCNGGQAGHHDQRRQQGRALVLWFALWRFFPFPVHRTAASGRRKT